MGQLKDHNDISSDQIGLDIIDLSLPMLKNLGKMASKHGPINPQFIVNGCIKARITGALDNGISDLSDESDLVGDKLPVHECSDPRDNSDSDENTYSNSEDGHLYLHDKLRVKEDAVTEHTEVILLSDRIVIACLSFYQSTFNAISMFLY